MDYLSEIKKGNDAVLVELYRLYRNEFISWSWKSYGISNEDAKDVFQDSVIAFYNNVKSGQLTSISGSVKTYLFTIGKFKTINFLKKQNKSVTFSESDLLKVIEPSENQIMDKEEDEFIKDTVKKYLNEQCEDCKKVLELYYFKELDMKSIAEEMGYKNADVAKKKKYECFKKLAEMVRKNTMFLVF